MDVRMVMQILAPAMQHGDEADLGAEMPGIGGDRAQRLSCRLEQDRIDRNLVLESDRRNLGRQREHNVEIGNRQKLVLPRSEPFPAGLPLAFGAMPVAAGIIGHTDRPAGPAALDMAAEFGGPAQLDGAHHATLDASEMAVMNLPIRLAVAAEDIRHLQSRRHGRDPISPAARPRCSAGRAGLSCAGSDRSRPWCSAPCSTGCCDRAEPG